MKKEISMVFDTHRLTVHKATSKDVSLYFNLWTNPDVMSFVGFPQGLTITQREIADKIQNQGTTVLGHLLVVKLKTTGEAIGECKMHPPNQDSIAETDVKLLPTHWGHKFGVEIKRGLLTFLFTHTDCAIVQATPNVKNAASIKMQEAVGGVRVGEATDEFPETMKSYTKAVHHYIYHVFREDWMKAQEQGKA
ncbi:MAG: GNAT family N-acetyltransferase [Chloroflexi bacterium]|nr:GNAT family N-acetyltransferase [Chloroflexota bacterium]